MKYFAIVAKAVARGRHMAIAKVTSDTLLDGTGKVSGELARMQDSGELTIVWSNTFWDVLEACDTVGDVAELLERCQAPQPPTKPSACDLKFARKFQLGRPPAEEEPESPKTE